MPWKQAKPRAQRYSSSPGLPHSDVSWSIKMACRSSATRTWRSMELSKHVQSTHVTAIEWPSYVRPSYVQPLPSPSVGGGVVLAPVGQIARPLGLLLLQWTYVPCQRAEPRAQRCSSSPGLARSRWSIKMACRSSATRTWRSTWHALSTFSLEMPSTTLVGGLGQMCFPAVVWVTPGAR